MAAGWMALLRPAPLSRYLDVFSGFLTSSSFPIFVVYLIAVFGVSRWWKTHTKPVDLRRFLVLYNTAVSIVNIVCFLGFARCLLHAGSIFEKRDDDVELIRVYHLYWITKVVELCDTLFMVMRHKFRQLTPLHVYHHASMLLLSDIGCSRYPWAAFAMPLMLNSLVHIFLYAYYAVTALTPSGAPPPVWKRSLTQLQIAQFAIDLIHAGVGFVKHGFCAWSIAYGVSMLYLFTTFYRRAYLVKKRE